MAHTFKPEIFCPDCKSKLDTPLVDQLYQGVPVYCESCGYKFSSMNLKEFLTQPKDTDQTRLPPTPPPTAGSDSSPKIVPRPPIPPRPPFEHFNSQQFASIAGFRQLVDASAYESIKRQNRKDFETISNLYRKEYQQPTKQNRKNYRKTRHYHKKQFRIAQKKNKQLFKATLLQYPNADKGTIKGIKREFKRVKRNNWKLYNKTIKTIKKEYKTILKGNKKQLKSIIYTLEKSFQVTQRSNRIAFAKVFQTGEVGLNYQLPFQPPVITSPNYQIYTSIANIDTGKVPIRPTESVISPSTLPQKVVPIAPVSESSDPNSTFNQVFTVLTPKVRARLINLAIPAVDRNIVARAFIYLTEDQQIKYLDELEQINAPNMAIRGDLIQALRKLPIPVTQQDFLIDQLNYIREEKQDAFVHEMKEGTADENREINVHSEDHTIESPQHISKSQEESPKEPVSPPLESEALSQHSIADLLQHSVDQYKELTPLPEASVPQPEPSQIIVSSSSVQSETSPNSHVELDKEEEKAEIAQLVQEKLTLEKLKRERQDLAKMEQERLNRVKDLKEKVQQQKQKELSD